MSGFFDHEGNEMVPLVCELCGKQIGLRSPGPRPDPAWAIVRCYACATVEEAERIIKESA